MYKIEFPFKLSRCSTESTEMGRSLSKETAPSSFGTNDTSACKAVEGLANKSDLCKPVLISLYSNSAAAQLKLSEWKAAEESASSALALDSTNSKCLFRRGVARSKLNMLSSAKDDLMAACRADPKDRNARTELAAVQEALKVQKASEKMSFAEKFGAATERLLKFPPLEEARWGLSGILVGSHRRHRP